MGVRGQEARHYSKAYYACCSIESDRLGKSNVVRVVGSTDLLEDVLRRDGLEDVLLGRFLDLATDQQLVQDEVRLLEVEDDVQLAHLQPKKKG